MENFTGHEFPCPTFRNPGQALKSEMKKVMIMDDKTFQVFQGNQDDCDHQKYQGNTMLLGFTNFHQFYLLAVTNFPVY